MRRAKLVLPARIVRGNHREGSIETAATIRRPLVSGVFVAMTLPRTTLGGIEMDWFSRHLEALLGAGVQGLVLNGATGEYCQTSSQELGQILARARGIAGNAVRLLAGIGAASLVQAHRRLDAAQASGADGLLLPMPHFFPYEQQDLIAFTHAVAQSAKLPVLLYNLPRFTTPIEPATTLELVLGSPAIEGIKDSSGDLDTLRLLKQSAPQANRVVGNDGALSAAMLEDLCDGVVSGVASALPELMHALYTALDSDPHSEESRAHSAALNSLLPWLDKFPVPWGLKIVAAERGLCPADFPFPQSPGRLSEARAFLHWLRDNRSALLMNDLPGANSARSLSAARQR